MAAFYRQFLAMAEMMVSKSQTTLRAYAGRALRKIGAEARSAIPALQAALADPDEKVAQAAAQALDQIQEETDSGWYLKVAG